MVFKYFVKILVLLFFNILLVRIRLWRVEFIISVFINCWILIVLVSLFVKLICIRVWLILRVLVREIVYMFLGKYNGNGILNFFRMVFILRVLVSNRMLYLLLKIINVWCCSFVFNKCNNLFDRVEFVIE